MAGYDTERDRKALQAFIENVIEGEKESTVNDWCSKSKVSSSAVYNFLRGESESLNLRTLRKLAAGAGVGVGDLLVGVASPAEREAAALARELDQAPDQRAAWFSMGHALAGASSQPPPSDPGRKKASQPRR